ncbi:hypothetical protein GW17_00035507 [Ensete ventricosum]|nr:hypothetical protein GW17_00035507 [Ensete ventricosum]
MRTTRYRAVPPKIDCQRSISAVSGRLREKSTVGGRLSEKKGRRRGKEEKKKRGEEERPSARTSSSLARRRRSHVVLTRAPSTATGRQRSHDVAARGSWALFLPCEEKDRGDFQYGLMYQHMVQISSAWTKRKG